MVKPMSDHLSLHSKKSNHDKAIKAAQDAAPEWHRSEEGRRWHKHHYEEMKDVLHENVTKICEHCGNQFDGKKYSKFCSNVCKSANRRKLGLDNVYKSCEKCGELFETSKYTPNKYCSSCRSGKRAE